MNIQELYSEIDKQYDLYISEEGADADTLHMLWDVMNDYKKVAEDMDYADYYIKLAHVILHRIDGVVIHNGIKQKYTTSSGAIRVQII